MSVRPRRPGDLCGLLALLQRTHAHEGYPVRPEAVCADWLADPRELGGWVVDEEGVRGHVALHPPHSPARDLWQQTAGTDALVAVTRLFTDRTVAGTGTALLQHAVEQAARLHRTAVLEVVADSPAHGFYVRRGWRDAGRCVLRWGHRDVDVAALVQPEIAHSGT